MAFARLVTWRFKPGTREKAMKVIDRFSEETKETEGFVGLLVLNSMDDPDLTSVLTVWDSEEALNSSRKGVFERVREAYEDLLAEPPRVTNFESRGTSGQLVCIPA